LAQLAAKLMVSKQTSDALMQTNILSCRG